MISDEVLRPVGMTQKQTHSLLVGDGPVCLLIHVPVAELADMLRLQGQLAGWHKGARRGPRSPPSPGGSPCACGLQCPHMTSSW